jgi:ornithine carbamoyltransferase
MKKDFLSVHDITRYEFHELLDLTHAIKKDREKYRKTLKNQVLAMIFEKPSLRTRMTFEVGMLELGGTAIYLSPNEIQLGKRETVEDVAHNLERWVDGIMIRTFAHDNVLRLAAASKVPVINALTDLSHPCQAMADFFTLREQKGGLSELKLAWSGDGNNVCHSLMLAAAKAGTKMAVATPKGYEPNPEIVRWAREDGRETGFELLLTNDPKEAVRGADAIYADVWTSMGQEAEKEDRLKTFAPYQVNPALMDLAKPGAIFMHCLPAHRGEEVTASVFDSPRSVVFDQAENRLHIQKAIMLTLMGKKEKHG